MNPEGRAMRICKVFVPPKSSNFTHFISAYSKSFAHPRSTINSDKIFMPKNVLDTNLSRNNKWFSETSRARLLCRPLFQQSRPRLRRPRCTEKVSKSPEPPAALRARARQICQQYFVIKLSHLASGLHYMLPVVPGRAGGRSFGSNPRN